MNYHSPIYADDAVDQPTALYRHFDEAGRLLYVGISLSAIARLQQHKQHAEWFSRIRTVTIEWHPNREAAQKAEMEAIRREFPTHNIMGNVNYGRAWRDTPLSVKELAVRRGLVELVIPHVDWDWLCGLAKKTGCEEGGVVDMICEGLVPLRLRHPKAKDRKPGYVQRLIDAGIKIE